MLLAASTLRKLEGYIQVKLGKRVMSYVLGDILLINIRYNMKCGINARELSIYGELSIFC
jgi:hypothetical protein